MSHNSNPTVTSTVTPAVAPNVQSADLESSTDDLSVFLDIVQLVNVHSDEEELTQAVLHRLDQMSACAGIVFRRLEPIAGVMYPCPLRDTELHPDGLMANASPELRELLNTVALDVDGTWEGLALSTNSSTIVDAHNIPNFQLSNSYQAVVDRTVTLGATAALFLPVYASEPIGTIALYSIGDVVVDARRAQLLSRAAQVLAFGIEKCRALNQVGEQSEALQAANDRLAESNRDLEDFAYVASHDLQEPLRKIQAFGDRLESKAGDRLTAESVQNLQRMQSASQRMQLLINDLLRYSRVTSASVPTVQIQLGPLLEEVATKHRRQVTDLGGVITIENELPSVAVDPGQFEQIFDTLISNAIKYRRPVKALEIAVRCNVDHPGFHEITFSDNGIGFDQKYADRVFEPFKRLHSSADYEGSGIGLAVCRRILDRHNGAITVESQPGNGSMFSVWLPTQPGNPVSEEAEVSKSSESPSRGSQNAG